MRAVLFFVLAFLIAGANGAQAQDCDCGKAPYVFYELDGEDLEIDESPWRVAVITAYDADLTQSEEPAICEVKLDLIPVSDPVLYRDFQKVPDGDFELNFEGEWMLASEFEELMTETDCLSSEKLS